MLVSRVNSLQSVFGEGDGLVYSLQSHSRVDLMVGFLKELQKKPDSAKESRSKRFQSLHNDKTHVRELSSI